MSTQDARKNVILITFDDAVAFWKYKTAFGEALQTPNLDRICAESTAFQAAYCQAPVCSPSRASFMSGQSPHQSGVTGPYKNYFEKIPAEAMWPYKLKQAGYFCSSGGKVMQGYDAPPPTKSTKLFFPTIPRSSAAIGRSPRPSASSSAGCAGAKRPKTRKTTRDFTTTKQPIRHVLSSTITKKMPRFTARSAYTGRMALGSHRVASKRCMTRKTSESQRRGKRALTRAPLWSYTIRKI